MHLKHITSKKNGIALFDFEHYFSWFNHFKLSFENPDDTLPINQFYEMANQILVPEVTGIMLSPDFGWHVLHTKPAEVGVVFSLEQKTEEVDPLANPRLSSAWTIEHIRNNYGMVKLELHYHPQEQNAVQKRKFVSELYEYAQYEGIDFILDLKVKNHSEFISSSEDFQNAQIMSIKYFRQMCDALFLELPGDALATATVTAELDMPWVLSATSYQTYQEYKEVVRMCIENGAKGAVINHSIIADILHDVPLTTENSVVIRKEMETVVRDRVIEIRRIIDEGQGQ